MAQRYDLISPRPGKEGKTFFTRVGTAFPREKGGFSLIFDALPLPDDKGRVSVLMVEPRVKDDRPQQPGKAADLNDDIPF